jgi:hypothetical protein
MILVPLFDLKFLDGFAAGGAGTSNRRHWGIGTFDGNSLIYDGACRRKTGSRLELP